MQGQSPCPRSAERGTFLCLLKRRRGFKGEPSPGVPPFLFFTLLRVRRYAGWWSLPCPAIRPHFFGACPKKRCRAAKEKRFEASTSPWWARPPLPFGRKPQRDELVRQVDLYSVGRPGAQVSLTQSTVLLGLRVRGRGGRDQPAPVAAPKSAFLWGSTPFLCARAKKWGEMGSRGKRLLPKKTAHTHIPPTSTSPAPSRAKMTPVY